MKLKSVIIFLSLALVHTGAAFAQAQQAEAQINQYLEGISYWRFQYSEEDTSFGHKVVKEDSVMRYNELLFNYLTADLPKVAGVLKVQPKFPETSDLKVVSSTDKKVRVYSWDTHTGGTMHFYNAVVLYEGKNGKVFSDTLNFVSKGEKVPTTSGEYIDILEVADKGKKIYLLVSKSVLSTSLVARSISAYSLQNELFRIEKIFQEQGVVEETIFFEYDYMSNYDFEKMKEEHTIHLSKNSKKLYAPVVAEGRLNGKWKVYNFDGGKFVYDKTE